MTSPRAPHAHRSPADRMASIVMSVLAVAAGLVSAFFSPFFVMSTDACGHNDCRDSLDTFVIGAQLASSAAPGD